MKSRIRKTLLILMLVITSATSAQENTLELMRTLVLEPTSSGQTVDVEIAGDVSSFKLKVMCDIEQGQVIIEVFDPSGSKQGKFTVGSEGYVANKSEELFNNGREYGKLEKNIKDPENGTWKIKVIQKKAKGNLSIRSLQEYRSK